MGREGFEEAVYWLELLIKYGNLDHLRINDFDLNLAQYFCLDVLTFFLVLFLGLLGLLAWLVKVTMVGWLQKTRLPYKVTRGGRSMKKKTL